MVQQARSITGQGSPETATASSADASQLPGSDRLSQQKDILAQVGSRGALVEQLQKDLNANGVRTKVDRSFGNGTASGLRTFESREGLVQDGKLDQQAQTRIQEKAAAIRAQDKGETAIIASGESGIIVEEIQKALIKSGFSVGRSGPDGDYGGKTGSAVSAFRVSCGLPPEGGITPTVLKLLGVEDALKRVAANHLKILGVKEDLTDPTTLQAALTKFQQDNSLTQTGAADQATLKKLIEKTTPITQQIEQTPVALTQGMQGTLVNELQSKLMELGYYKPNEDKASGIIDQKTIAAVSAWRSEHGLKANGKITMGVLSELGIDLRTHSESLVGTVKGFEGFYPRAKLCPGGTLTIGHGHTRGVRWGQTTDKAEAERFLRRDLAESSVAIQNRFGSDLPQKVFDALVSFHFNLGGGWMTSSSLAGAVDKGNMTRTAEVMKRYVYADCKKLPGLVIRRETEAGMLLDKEETPERWISQK